MLKCVENKSTLYKFISFITKNYGYCRRCSFDFRWSCGFCGPSVADTANLEPAAETADGSCTSEADAATTDYGACGH